jgi:hypothetical protein
MNYSKIYDEIVKNRKINEPIGYYEKHHIIPKSLGGDDSSENIVKLTPREHFICHHLLLKMQIKGSQQYFKMLKAFNIMFSEPSEKGSRCGNSKLYSHLKKDFSIMMSDLQSGDKNSQFGSRWINDGYKDFKTFESVIPEGFFVGRVKKEKEVKFNDTRTIKGKLFTHWLGIYNKVGFEEFCRIIPYKRSRSNLYKQFELYAEGYLG